MDLPKQSPRKQSVQPLRSDTKDNLTEGQREHYFKITDPPHLAREEVNGIASTTESTLISVEPTCEESLRTVNPLLGSHALELGDLTNEWGSLSLEGKKQAEEAGLKLGCSIKRPISHSPPEIPQKKAHQDRWAAYSRINTDPQLQEATPPTENKPHTSSESVESHRPLLEVFEAELAKLLCDDPVPPTTEETVVSAPDPKPADESLAPESTPESRASETKHGQLQDNPVELLGQAVRGFVDGIGLLTSEVRSNIPEAQEQLLNAQQNLPHVVRQTVFSALRGWGSHVQRIANNVQLASVATRNAAERTRGLDTPALDGVVSGLHGLAVGLGEMGGALFPGMTLESTTEPSEGEVERNSDTITTVPEATTPATELAHPIQVTVEDESQTVDVSESISSSPSPEGCTQPGLASTMGNHTSDGSFGGARSKFTDGEYEKIHRTKREEAADSREANRQRLRRLQQEADEAYQSTDPPTSLNGRQAHTVEASQFISAQEEKQYYQSKDTRAGDKGPYHPKPYCLLGCTSSSSCRHRRASGSFPYPARNDFYRSRPTRRAPLHYTSQLPYEYIVPPPEFYETSKSDLTSSQLRHNVGRNYARSRLPETGYRESGQDTSPSSWDWPKVQRYGPIHLPDSARRPSDNTWTSPLPHPRSPRSLDPFSRWTDVRSTPPRGTTPGLSWEDASSQPPRQLRPEVRWEDSNSQTARQPNTEIPCAKGQSATTPAVYCPSGSQCGLIPADPAESLSSGHNDVGHHKTTLRHRQSWHPSSATKTPERWNMTSPERSTVSFVEPNGVSSVPSRDRVLQHRRSTGLFTNPDILYSTTKDVPSPASGAQIEVTQPNGQSNSAYPAYSGYYSSFDQNTEQRSAQGDLGNKKLGRVGRDSLEFKNSRASVDLPWNERAHYASPVKKSNIPVRAATISNGSPRGEHDISSELESLSSVSESVPTEWIAPELKRFPTLAQLESGTSKTLSSFPPLPSMEPLIPVRTHAIPNAAPVPGTADKIENKTDADKSQSSSINNGLTQADAPQTSESSGQFFQRMTGLGTPSLAQRDGMAPAASYSPWPLARGAGVENETTGNMRPNKCPVCDKEFARLDNYWSHIRTHTRRRPDAPQSPDHTQIPFAEIASRTPYQPGQSGFDRVNTKDRLESLADGQPTLLAKYKSEQGESRLTRPFDPLAESVTLHRSRLIDNFRRTTAQRRSLHDYYAGNRRPYSDYFTGNGRLGWESFLAKHDTASSRPATNADHPTISASTAESVVSETSESIPRSEAPNDNAGEHHDAKTVAKVQACVDQLRSLGFGTMENGGEARLLVYAQAAEGNLEDAIETIEEERKAYEQRSDD